MAQDTAMDLQAREVVEATKRAKDALSEELTAAMKDRDKYDTQAHDLQAATDKAADKAEKARNPERREALRAEADLLHRQLMRAIHAGTILSERIKVLRSPEELERRVYENLGQSGPTPTPGEGTPRPNKPSARSQGVPEVYLSDTGTFRVGMDARLKSDLVSSALGLITKRKPGESLQVFTVDEALRLLEARDWMGYLDKKAEKLGMKIPTRKRGK